ncbi:MAG: FecR domain-containing protein [bacterium]
MKNRHLDKNEIVAMVSKEFDPLPETVEHLRECEECLEKLKRFRRFYDAVSMERVSEAHIPEDRLEDVAARSFSEIPVKDTHSSKSLTDRIKEFFSSPIPALTLGAAAVAIFISVFAFTFMSNESEVEGTEKRVADRPLPEPSSKGTAPLINISETPAVAAKGERFESEEVSLSFIKDTKIMKKSERSFAVESGTVKVNVRKKGDFSIEIRNLFSVRVLGTIFTVDINSDKDFSVSVKEGRVEVVDLKRNSSHVLSANRHETFKFKPEKAFVENNRKVVAGRGKQIKKLNEDSAPKDFLAAGRDAVSQGNLGKALDLFNREISVGQQKDKALFEKIRVLEKQKKTGPALESLIKHSNIVNRNSVYYEEFLFKGCKFESTVKGHGGRYCAEYVREFPDGYKIEQIKRITDETNE